MGFGTFIFQFLEVTLFFQAVTCQTSIQWVTRSPNQILRSGIEPAGYEGGQKTFLCRLQNGENYSIGKIALLNTGPYTDEVQCSIRTGESVMAMYPFQVLEYPPDTLSWMPLENPNFNVAVGSNFENRTIYVCRADVPNEANTVSVGYVDPARSLECQLTIEGPQNSIVEFELLVVNLHGQRLGMAAPKN